MHAQLAEERPSFIGLRLGASYSTDQVIVEERNQQQPSQHANRSPTCKKVAFWWQPFIAAASGNEQTISTPATTTTVLPYCLPFVGGLRSYLPYRSTETLVQQPLTLRLSLCSLDAQFSLLASALLLLSLLLAYNISF